MAKNQKSIYNMVLDLTASCLKFKIILVKKDTIDLINESEEKKKNEEWDIF